MTLSNMPTESTASVGLGVSILTVSDTRTLATDTSGAWLVEAVLAAGHAIVDRSLVVDDPYHIRAKVSGWIIHPSIQVIITTGGTGFSHRDTTPEALMPLFDREIVGFGEYFRQLSVADVGASTIQSRAVAGFSNEVAIFALPGSTKACRTAWTEILATQLNAAHKPCNFVSHLKRVSSQDESIGNYAASLTE
jgi:molybdenum cofactor biosynthesis protein B